MARSFGRMQGRRCKHVHEIPYSITHEICMAMDASGSWKSLAGELNMTLEWVSIAEQGRGDYKSPSTALLREWGQLNPTIEEFFRILHKLGLYREMQRMKSVVSSKLHYLANPNVSRAGDPMRTEDLPGPIDTDDVTSAMPPGVSTRFQQQPSSREYEQMTEPHTVAKVSSSINMAKESVKGTTQETHRETSSAANSNAFRVTGLNEFCYEDIRTATSEFSDKNKLGAGGFSKVFYCEMDGTGFAMKVFSPRNTSMDKEALVKLHWNEIEKLTKHRHPNIINLCGYSNNGPEFCLVLEYMAKGSLEKCLTAKRGDQQRNHLSWYMRYKILKDAACGLQYLHSRKCTHGDIKSANILLDANFVAKLADFDLAKQVATSQNMAPNATGYTKVTPQDVNGNEKTFGTLAYLPSDFVSDGARHSRFTDVYSFGVVICEVLTGLKAYSKTEERQKQFLKDRVKEWLKEHCRGGQGQGRDLVGLYDRNAEGWPGDLWARLMDLALHCLNDKKTRRPNGKQLHERLTDLLKDAAKLNEISEEPKKEGKGMNKLGSYDCENIMNIVGDDSGPFNQVKGIASPPYSSMAPFKGSSEDGKCLTGPATEDLYGPGNAAKKYEEEETRWLNYDPRKLENDGVERSENNLKCEADDPKFLRYDEKKLSNETALQSPKLTNPEPNQLFNGLPKEAYTSVGSNANYSGGQGSIPSSGIVDSQSKSFQELMASVQQNFLANVPESFKLQCYHEMLQKMQRENQRQQNQQQGMDQTSQNVSSGSMSPKMQYLGGPHSSLPDMNNGAGEMLREDFSLPNIKISSENPTERGVATNVDVRYDMPLPNNLEAHSPTAFQVSPTDSSQLSSFNFGTSSQYPTTIQACASIGFPSEFPAPNMRVSSRESSTNSSTNPSMNPSADSNHCVRDDSSIPSTPSTPHDSNYGGQFVPSVYNNVPLSAQYSPAIPDSAANIGVNLSEPNVKSTQNPASQHGQVINQLGTTQPPGLTSANLQFDEVEDFRQKVDNLSVDFNLTDDLDNV